MGKIGCVAIVKNEQNHIAEWLVWQFLLGFDTVFLLDNASTDATAKISRALASRFDIRVVDWPGDGQGFQARAYEHAARLLADEFDWLAFFDTDEFLVLDEGLELRRLLAARPESNIAVPWAMFGSSGHVQAPDGLIITNFVHRSQPGFPPNRHIKSIIRPSSMRACLNPHAFDCGQTPVDMFGRKVTLREPGLLAEAPVYDGAKLHHYFTRSRAHWQARLARGNLGTPRTAEEFHTYDRNEVFDDSARRAAPRLSGLLSEAAAIIPKTCAVVLVVKDEAADIACWLAWYHLLGFDACIVFDDHSTDGTYEMLSVASRVQNIHLYRTKGPRDTSYQVRQVESYRFALAEYVDEFEWLAFFDADEYLSLVQDKSVKSFLARFPEADQVSVNWCNYGSSGHYLKPRQPPIQAYTWHRAANQPINRHVKSFVRPRKAGPDWVNVHCFNIPPEKRVLANGQRPNWSGEPGIIDKDPDWSVAKLMHYQCRSMEHFIERLKKRPQFQSLPGLWQRYDINEVEDTAPLRLVPRLRAQLAAIARGVSQRPVPELIFDIGMSEGNDTAFYLAKGFRVVGLEPDVRMFYALQERFAAEIASSQLVLLNLAAGARHGEIVEFFHHNQAQGISGLSNSRSEFASGYESYHVMTIDWTALTEKYGVPHYAKIDIEGHEVAFLNGAAPNSPLPSFISAECYSLAPARALHALGYGLFKLIDQNSPGGFQLPEHQSEGGAISWPEFSHASGPFGRDLPGEWVDFEGLEKLWQAAEPQLHRIWFDCHAWMP